MARRCRCASMIARRNHVETKNSAASIVVDVTDRSNSRILTTYKLTRLAKGVTRSLLSERDVRDAEVSVLFVDDKQMAELNERHRERKEPTDVLSFALRDEAGPSSMSNILGDVVVSVETAKRQADEAGHSVAREVAFLLIHGLLHLLGFDHAKGQKAAKEMRRCEESYRELICEELSLVS